MTAQMAGIVREDRVSGRQRAISARCEGEEHGFGYRTQRFPRPSGLDGAAFDHPAAARATRRRFWIKMNDFAQRRRDKQPLNFPSAGSTFKRPEGYFAGQLIEDAGLKGASVGAAQVSEKHAGFLINRGGATCDDMLRLIELVQSSVREQFGVELECEVRIVR